MQPVTINLPSHTTGDTWEGLIIGPVTFDGGAPPANLDSCKMYLRGSTIAVALKFKTTPGVGENTITIDDATTWEVTVPAVIISLDAGEYNWDFETTDTAGAVRTLYKGIWAITKDVTRD